MHVVYLTPYLDGSSVIRANQVAWLRRLDEQPSVDRVTLIAEVADPADLPPDVRVVPYDRDSLRSQLGAVVDAVRHRREPLDVYVGAQCSARDLAVLIALRLVRPAPLIVWKAHPALSRWFVLLARLGTTRMVTATESSLPASLRRKVDVIGHGVEVSAPDGDVVRDRDLVIFGRLSRIKRIEESLDAIAASVAEAGWPRTVDLIGPIDGDRRRELEAHVTATGLEGRVTIRGPVDHREVGATLRRYRFALQLSGTALDKGVLECMAAGVVPLTSNPCTAEILPLPLAETLFLTSADAATVGARLAGLGARPEAEIEPVRTELNEIAVARHGLDTYWDRFMDAAAPHLRDRPAGGPVPSEGRPKRRGGARVLWVKRTVRSKVRDIGGGLATRAAVARPSTARLEAMRHVLHVQMSGAEMHPIAEAVAARPGCRLLVFGLGHDSSFWARLNAGGETLFIEDDTAWVEVSLRRDPSLAVVTTTYTTVRSDWQELMATPERLALDLPPEVTAAPWDVVVVDAPRGHRPETPGRMQSIVAARDLVGPDGAVFVHDSDRTVEREYGRAFLGDPPTLIAGRLHGYEHVPGSHG